MILCVRHRDSSLTCGTDGRLKFGSVVVIAKAIGAGSSTVCDIATHPGRMD
jgi:hypothetical protein